MHINKEETKHLRGDLSKSDQTQTKTPHKEHLGRKFNLSQTMQHTGNALIHAGKHLLNEATLALGTYIIQNLTLRFFLNRVGVLHSNNTRMPLHHTALRIIIEQRLDSSLEQELEKA